MAAFFDPQTESWQDAFEAPGAVALVLSGGTRHERGWLADLDGTTLYLCSLDENTWRVYSLNTDNTWTLSDVSAHVVGPPSWDDAYASAWTYYGQLTEPRRLYGTVSGADTFWESESGYEPDMVDLPGPCNVSLGPQVYGVTAGYVYRLHRGPWITNLSASSYGSNVQVSWDYQDAEALAQKQYRVQLLSGGSVAYDSGVQSGAGTSHTFSDVGAGQYTVRVTVWNTDGLTSDPEETWVTVSGSSSQPGGDTTPPTVTIMAPEQGATVSGSVVVRAALADNVALDAAALYVDNVQQEMRDVSGTQATVEFSWDAAGWANGEHTISVRAWDTSANNASAAVTVTVNNLLAAEPKVLFTKQQPQAGTSWRLGQATPRLAMIVPQTGELPSDPRQRYNVLAGFHVPGDSVNFDDYTLVEPGRAFALPTSAQSVRFALKAQPQVNLSWWEESPAEFFRILQCDGRLIVVGRTPASLWELSGASLTQLANLQADLGVATVYDAAYEDGKVYVGTDVGLVAYDLDSGEEPLVIRLPLMSADPRVRALSVDGISGGLYLRHEALLHRFEYPSPQKLSDQVVHNAGADGGYLLAIGGQVLMGTDMSPVEDKKGRIHLPTPGEVLRAPCLQQPAAAGPA
ncbi:MAG: PKD domain-containing protein, partial [Armatimonadetes bacterium]|nr:PKD domain-containing protein [Armatimonadota bacterium]